MKVSIKFLGVLFIAILLSLKLNAQIYISEGFEGTSSLHVPPQNWIPDINAEWWFFQNGGYDAGSPYHRPANAHSGIFNAMFKTFSTTTSKLQSPQVDLRFSIKPVLSFWYAQELRASINDKLKVYYRTSPAASWVLLESYTNPTPQNVWVNQEIILPDAAKTQTCQIAFEGSSQNLSWGVCIDDILLEEKGNLPRQVESISLIQKNYFIPSNSSTNPLGIIGVNISGNTGNETLKSISFEYTGTNINDINITSTELFYTRDTVFSTKNKLTSSISSDGNTITLSNINYDLQTGENYLWVCSSIKSTAVHNNKADFKLLQNSINIQDILFPGVTLDPSESSTIEESVFFDGFEALTGWQISPGACWQIGAPTGIGTNDPDFTFSGTKVLATNLTGNYPNGIQPSNPHMITSPSINAKFYQNLYLRFKRWLNFEYFDKTTIQCSVDGGSTWVYLWENNTSVQDQNWKSLSYSINQLAKRKQDVKIRFSIDSSDISGLFGGWNIDNFAITGDYISNDIGISNIDSPVTHCGMTNNETVIVKIKNYGGQTVNGPYDVGFSTDNGATYTRETVNLSINSEQEITYPFTAKANLSQIGLKQLKFKTFLTGDEDSSNDTYSTSLFVYPTENYNYLTSFETSNKYWNPSGTNSSWAWGIVAKSTINKAADGTKVWVTNLKYSHASSEQSYLESPCFDFTNSEYPVIAFDYWVNTESGTDGFRIDFSIDGGTTWNPIPANSNYNQNWFTGNMVSALGTDGWSGSTSTGYELARTLLPSSVNGKNNVKFRFAFASDASTSLEGVAIDNFRIYELPYDVGVKRLVSPISGCYIGNNVKLTAKVKNFGYRPLKAGLKVPMKIKLRNESVVNDTLVVGSLVAQNDSTTFTSTASYNIFNKGTHQVQLNTNFAIELNRANDTLKTSLQVRGIPGYSLGPDKAVTTVVLASGVELDAGLNGALPYNNYLWSTTETSRKISVTTFADYNVTVTNENGCTAKDTIKVIESTSDITILSANGLSDACQYPASTKPTITIKNNGPNTIGPSSTITKSIPLAIEVDGVVKVIESFLLPKDLKTDSITTYTFTNSINISTPKSYEIKIYSRIIEDPIKTNDTLIHTTNVWGMPDVNLPYDTIATYQADTLKLNARKGFATYKWQNNAPSAIDSIYNVTSLNSAWYKVTVTDIHGCGSDKDSVFVNAKDLSVLEIESPFNAFCTNPVPKVSVRVKNAGRDDFAAGSVIKLSYVTPSESITQNFTLGSVMAASSTLLLTFDNYIKIPIGEGFVSVTAEISNDPINGNNILEKSVVKLTNPTVSFNPSTLYKVFGSEPYTISPIYSSDVKSFEWQDSRWDSLYVITGNPPARTLSVIAYDGLNHVGCSDTAYLNLVSEDIVVDAIKSPTNQCELGSGIPIKVSIANKGNFAYPAGTSLTIGINVDGVNYPNEVKNLATNLDPNGTVDYTLNPTLNLTGKTSSITSISVSTAIDANTSNNSINKTVYATGYPTVSLGADRTVHASKDTLTTGGNFLTYNWKFNSNSVGTDTAYIATQTGNYSVTVTDYNGCPATDDVNLTFVIDDISLYSIDNPISECNLSSTEPVKVTVKNTGSEVIPINKQIEIGFTQDGVTKKENFTLASNLSAGQTRTFDLANSMSFPLDIPYPIDVWVKMLGDMNSSNDTLSTTVEKYPQVGFDFGIDTIKVQGSDTTLVATSGFTTYLWNTGATTESIDVNTSGDYWVEVTNSYGCSDRDTLYVKIGIRDISVKSLVVPSQTSCALTSSETVTVRLENTGTNVIPNGTSIQLKLTIASTLVATENCILTSDLAVGATKDYSFTYKPNLSSIGNYLIEISSLMANDEVSSNNNLTKNIVVNGAPTPNLGVDRIISTPTLLDAGAGVGSTYLWSTGATTQTITVSTSGTYSVTVTDANNCTGFDEVTLTWQENVDVQATALVSPLASPLTNCYNSEGQTITITLKNLGSSTLTSGQTIDVSYQVNTNTPVVQTLTLTSDLATNQTRNFTFNQKASLDPQTYTLYFKTTINSVSGTTTNYPVIINANPVFAFSSDTIKTSLPYQLSSGISGVTYLWNTGSTNASIQVSTYGKYWLTVTNPTTGCSTTDTIVIANPTAVETIPGSNAKVTYFPNPVNNELSIKIETDKNESFTIDLVNPSGQIVKNIKTDKTLFYNDKINVNGLNSGLYLLKVGNGKGNAVFKVIVQH